MNLVWWYHVIFGAKECFRVCEKRINSFDPILSRHFILFYFFCTGPQTLRSWLSQLSWVMVNMNTLCIHFIFPCRLLLCIGLSGCHCWQMHSIKMRDLIFRLEPLVLLSFRMLKIGYLLKAKHVPTINSGCKRSCFYVMKTHITQQQKYGLLDLVSL